MVEYRSSQFIRLHSPWDIFPRGKDIPGRFHHLWIRCIGISILGISRSLCRDQSQKHTEYQFILPRRTHTVNKGRLSRRHLHPWTGCGTMHQKGRGGLS